MNQAAAFTTDYFTIHVDILVVTVAVVTVAIVVRHRRLLMNGFRHADLEDVKRLQGEGRSWRVRDIAGVGYLLSSLFCTFPKQKYYSALESYGFLRVFAVFLLTAGRPLKPLFSNLSGEIRKFNRPFAAAS